MISNIKKDKFLILKLAILPFFYFILIYFTEKIKGPAWVLVPQDLGYNYLISSVNFYNNEPLGSLIHPALTNIYLTGLLSFLYFKIFSNDLIFLDSVINNPELYFSISSYFISAFTTFFLLLLGLIFYLKFKKIQYSIFIQSFFLLANQQLLIFNSYASPESFLVLLFLIKIFIIFSFKDQNLEVNNKNFFLFLFLNSMVSALCVATKIIALPIIFLVFFFLKKKNQKFLYLLFSFFFIFIFFLPILHPENQLQLLNDIYGLFTTLVIENTDSTGSLNLGFYILKLTGFFKSFSIFFCLYLINLFLLLIAVFKNKKNDFLMRYGKASFIVTTLAILILTTRYNDGKYAFIYLIIILSSIISLTEKIFLEKKFKLKLKIFNSLFFTYSFVAICVFISNFNIKELKDDFKIISLMNKKKVLIEESSDAIITQIPSSNTDTALFHGFLTGQKINEDVFRKYNPKNHFNYNLTFGEIFKYGSGSFSVEEIFKSYENLYFWTKKTAFFERNNQKPPRAIWKKEIESKYELLSKILALQIGDFKDINSNNRNWTKKKCGKNNCYLFNNVFDEKINYFSIKDDNLKIKIRASNDKITWENINFKKNFNKNIFLYNKNNSQNIFELFLNKKYRYYEFTSDKFIDEIGLFYKNGCLSNKIHLPNRINFILNDIKTKKNIWIEIEKKELEIKFLRLRIKFLQMINYENNIKNNIKFFLFYKERFKNIFNLSFISKLKNNEKGKIPGEKYFFLGEYPVVIETEFLEKMAIDEYKISFDSQIKSFVPTKWEFYGSNDKKNWILLDQKIEKSNNNRNFFSQKVNLNEKFRFFKILILNTYNTGNLVKFKNIKYYKNEVNRNGICKN